MDDSIKKQIKIFAVMIVIGMLVILSLMLINNSKDEVINIDNSNIPVEVRHIQSQQISWNNLALIDSTEYDETTNVCTGERYNMNIKISPCIARDVDGKDINQNVIFEWNGASQKNITWIFVYDGDLVDGSIGVLTNKSRQVQDNYFQDTWIDNYLVYGIVSYTNLTTKPTGCHLGNLNNSQFYEVIRNVNGEIINQTICFSDRTVVNGTAFRISGNYDKVIYRNKTVVEQEYVDVTDRIQYLGKGLLQDNRSYYKIDDVKFNPNQKIDTLWTYTTKDNKRFGKWHILGYETENGFVNSIAQDKYIYIDPWWSGSWSYKKPITITGAVPLNYSLQLIVYKNANMKSDFSDLRFLNGSEDTELKYWIEYYNTTEALVWVKVNNNQSIYMYYGNSGASDVGNISTVALYGTDFDGTALPVGWDCTWTCAVASGQMNWSVTAGSYGRIIYSGVGGSSAFNLSTYTENITVRAMGGGSGTEFSVSPIARSQTGGAGNSGSYHSTRGQNDKKVEILEWSAAGTVASTIYAGVSPMSYVANTPEVHEFKVWGINMNGTVYTPNTNRSAVASGQGTDNTYANGYTGLYQIGVSSRNSFTRWFMVRTSGLSGNDANGTFGAEEENSGVSIILNSPATASKTNVSLITFNYTITPVVSNITNWTLLVYYSNNSIAHIHQNLTMKGNVSVNIIHDDTLFADNSYIWNVFACVVSDITSVTTCAFGTNYTFQIHTTLPTFTLNSLPNVTTISLPVNATFNVTSTDTELNACWYGTNQNATLTTYTCNSTQNVLFTTGGTKTITVYANDTFGNSNSSTYTFRIYDFNVTQTANANTIAEGSSARHTLLINSTSFPIVDATATFYWNGSTRGATTKTVIDANSIVFVNLFDVVAGLGNTTGITYNWTWNYNTSILSARNTTLTNQTVISFAIDDCTVYGVKIANISIRDEETDAIFGNTTATNVEVDALVTSLTISGTQWTYHDTFINNSNFPLCVPTGVLNSSNFTIDLTIGYDAGGYVREFYYLDNGTLTNAFYFNSYTTGYINLEDLLTTDSTTFLFEFTDENNQQVDNAIVHVFRKYIGDGVFREVERARQDNNGQTHVHLVEEDVIYYFMITKEGRILYTSDEYNAKCLSTPCEILLTASPTETDWTLIYNEGGQYTTTTNDATRIVTTTFDNTVSTIVNVSLYEIDSDGQVSLVNTSSLTAMSGSISLTVPYAYGNKSFYVDIYENNTFIKSSIVNLEESGYGYFGITGALLGGIIVLVVVLMAVTEGVAFVVFTVLAVIIIAILKLVDMDWGALISIIVAGFIIVFKLVKRRTGA